MIGVARSLPAAAALFTAACVSAKPQRAVREVVIENVTIVSPERERPLGAASVVLRDGRIAAVAERPHVGPGALRIDGRGRYLVPGLIDTHVHVGHMAVLDDSVVERRPELLAAYRAQVPRAFLAFGFTTVVDLDMRPEDRTWFETTPLHPRLFHCGRGVRIPGGYGALRVRPDAVERDFPTLVYEPARRTRWPGTLDSALHTPAQVVQRVVNAGGICLKVFVEPGFGVFDWPVPRPETLDTLRAEAARHRLTFVVHATGVDSWREAVRVRADVIAHGLWHWPGNRLIRDPPAEARDVVRAAARAGVRVQPTLRVLQHDRTIFEAALLDDPRLAWALPAVVLAYLRSDAARAARHAMADSYEEAARGAGETAGAAALIDAAVARATATLRLMSEADVALIFGSDTPSGEGIGNPPGLNGRLELQHWAEAGVPLTRILRAATLANADAFGLGRELGSVEVGKRADLLLLGADPLESVAAYDSIQVVFLGGEPIRREALRPRD